jgi:rhamnogalacturonan endolyase
MNNLPFNRVIPLILLFATAFLGLASPVFANIPGSGTGTGPNVTLVDNGDGTVTMANGSLAIVIVKSSANITKMYYTYNNSGTTVTNQVLAGGKNGGQLYWSWGGFGSGGFSCSVVANTGDYAEVNLFSDSASNGTVNVHFSMLLGSPGFYVTPICSHRVQDGPLEVGEQRGNIYFSPNLFNWMSVNDQVQRELGLNASSAPAFWSPVENTLTTSGVLQGTYDDKYKWSADLGVERVWGWSNVSDAAIGFTGQNIGMWYVVASAEFYNGSPLKSELNDAPMVNMINGGHYGMGDDNGFGAGEVWTRASGPYFIYFNAITNTITDPVQASRALYADAV